MRIYVGDVYSINAKTLGLETVFIAQGRNEMVRASTIVYQCNRCMAEWAIEPEPMYSTWAEMGHDEPNEIDDDFIMCPFCGSQSTEKMD